MITWNHYKTWLEEKLIQAPSEGLPPQPDEIVYDTRAKSLAAQWFLPLVGESFDGHDYIESALEKGAQGAFCSKAKLSKVPIHLHPQMIVVEETLSALQAIAKGWRLTLKGLKLICLTGSVGKTTTKQLLGSILKEAGETLPFQNNLNNEIGVPQQLLKLKESTQYGVLELGARKIGDIDLLTRLCCPNYSLVLNVGSSHLGVFGSKEAIYKTKLELLASSPAGCELITYHDDPVLYQRACQISQKVKTFGKSPEAHGMIKEISSEEGEKQKLILELEKKPLKLTIQKGHSSLPVNIAAACLVAHLAGVSHFAISAGLQNYQGLPGRFQVHRKKEMTIVDDAYNSSFESVKAGLQSLTELFPEEKRVLVLGDMLELGSDSEKIHRAVGDLCVKVKPSLLITVGSHSLWTAEEASKKGLPKNLIRSFSSIETLLKEKIPFHKHGQVLYIKGSNRLQLNKLLKSEAFLS